MMPRLLSWFLALLALFCIGCGHAEAGPPAPLAVAQTEFVIPLESPASVMAGEPILINIGPYLVDQAETNIHLTLLGSYGPQLFVVTLYDGFGELTIPGSNTRRSGIHTLIASDGEARGELTIPIEPHSAVGPLTPLVGARSIVADGEHWAMTVLIPFDRFGNPIAAGTPVEIKALHPDDHLEVQTTETHHLVAWVRIYSTTTAGRTEVATQIGDIFGHEKLLLEVPGWPEPFDLTFDVEAAPADGFQYITIRSAVITDEFGNVMPDGTQVSFVVTGADGSARVMPAPTIDGVAEIIMQTPVVPGTVEVRGSVFGVASPPFTIDFTPGPAVGEFPVALEVDSANQALFFSAGPILGQLNQFVPDGTQVQFQFNSAEGHRFSIWGQTLDGFAVKEVRLADLPEGSYDVLVTSGAGQGALHFRLH